MKILSVFDLWKDDMMRNDEKLLRMGVNLGGVKMADYEFVDMSGITIPYLRLRPKKGEDELHIKFVSGRIVFHACVENNIQTFSIDKDVFIPLLKRLWEEKKEVEKKW